MKFTGTLLFYSPFLPKFLQKNKSEICGRRSPPGVTRYAPKGPPKLLQPEDGTFENTEVPDNLQAKKNRKHIEMRMHLDMPTVLINSARNVVSSNFTILQ